MAKKKGKVINITKGYESGLTDRQKKVIPFFISSKNYEDGCRAAKISKHAFYSWLQNPIFRAELSRLQDEVVNEAVQILKANMTRAIETLVSLLDQKDNPSLLRSVCNDIISHVAKFKELQEIEKRIEALERVSGE